jgi:hypothetical protein
MILLKSSELRYIGEREFIEVKDNLAEPYVQLPAMDIIKPVENNTALKSTC